MKHEYASKGKANAGLALGIIGTALSAMNTLGGGMALFGRNCGNGFGRYGYGYAEPGFFPSNNVAALEQKECEDNVALTRGIYDMRINDLKEKYAARNVVVDEMFRLYKNQRDEDDKIKEHVANLEKEIGEMKAVEPYKNALFEGMVKSAKQEANCKIHNEAMARWASDQMLVLYMNGTFAPQKIANTTPGTTTVTYTDRPLYNPVLPCFCPGNCNCG